MATASPGWHRRTTAMWRDPPAPTIDSWQCLAENLPDYLEVPKMTRAVLSAVISQPVENGSSHARSEVTHSFPEPSAWCGLTTSVAAPVSSTIYSYGTSASVWWKAHSSALYSFTKGCPLSLLDVILSKKSSAVWLNETIIFSDCNDRINPTPNIAFAQLPASTTRVMATPCAGASVMNMATPTATPTPISILGDHRNGVKL